MKFIIDTQNAGLTVLSFLKRQLKISTSALASLKRIDMGICVNEKHVTVRYILQDGDVLTIKDKDTFDDVNELFTGDTQSTSSTCIIASNVEYYDLAFYLSQNPFELIATDDSGNKITEKSDSGTDLYSEEHETPCNHERIQNQSDSYGCCCR